MAYGTKTSNILDIPLSISSVVTPYLGDNGYSAMGSNDIRVLDVPNGTLADYNETSATAPFGTAALVVPAENILTLAYNKSMLLRVQRTQIQDIPVSKFVKKTATQNADEVFVPAHDAYSIGKILAARPAGNKVVAPIATADLKVKFGEAVNKARTGGAKTTRTIAWVSYSFANELTAVINFTGSDKGYTEGKNGYIGKFKGVKVVETPDSYLGAGVHAIMADKKAIVNVKPKMDPKAGGVVFLDKVPGFSGVEIQLRDRGDTFVLSRKVNAVSSIEEA